MSRLEIKQLLAAVRQEKWHCSEALQHLTPGRLESCPEALEKVRKARELLQEAAGQLLQAAEQAGRQR